jgi:hypothetical protein
MPVPITGGVKLRDLVTEFGEDGVRDPAGIYCTAKVASRNWRLHVADGLHADDDVALVISTDALASRRLRAVRDLLNTVSGRVGAEGGAASVLTRSAVVHRAMLQALDGAAAHASHRDIAIAIFGRRVVLDRWSSDGELRARIRYFLHRGRLLVESHYRKLAYL